MRLHLLSVGIATMRSVWQKTPSFFVGSSVAPNGLNLAHRLSLDETVFIIEVAQIMWKYLGCGVVITLALSKADVPGGCLAFQPRRSCKKE